MLPSLLNGTNGALVWAEEIGGIKTLFPELV